MDQNAQQVQSAPAPVDVACIFFYTHSIYSKLVEPQTTNQNYQRISPTPPPSSY